MPIRAGSGGLKYPPPSQSDINARQSAAAASAGGSASATAFSANRRYSLGKKQLQNSALQSGYNRLATAQQGFLERGARAQQKGLDRDHEMGAQEDRQEQQLDVQTFEHAYQVGQKELGRQHTLDRDKAQWDRANDADILRRWRDGDLKLSPADDALMKQLEKDRAAADLLTPEDREEWYEKNGGYRERKRKILLRAERPQSPSAGFNRDIIHFNPKTGLFQDKQEPWTIPYDRQTRRPLDLGKPDKPDPSKKVPHFNKRTKKWEKIDKDEFKEKSKASVLEHKKWVEDRDEVEPLEEGGGKKAAQDKWVLKNPEPEVFPTIYDARQQEQEWLQEQERGSGGPTDPSQPGTPGPPAAPSGQAPPGAPPPDPQAAEEVAVDDPFLQAIIDRAFKIGDETGVGDISKIKDPEMKKEAEFLGRVFDAVSNGRPITGVKAEEAKWLPPNTVFYDDTGRQRRTKDPGEDAATPGNGGGSLGDVNR